MEREVTQRIRERAYQLWISSGSRDGQSEVNWLTAEKEVLAAKAAPTVKKQARKNPTKSILGLRTRSSASKGASAP
jgi:hypothetical protein